MDHKRYFKCVVLLALGIASCRGAYPARPDSTFCPAWTKEYLLRAAMAESIRSLNATQPAQKIEFAKRGMEWAERCVRLFPKTPGCYFYRAVNTGLYYESFIIGYQKGLKRIIKDCVRVNELDVAYEGGGAYRILGEIYLRAPPFVLSRKSVTRDLEKASQFILKAIEINPSHVENRLLWGEVLFNQEKYSEAKKILSAALLDFPRKRSFTLRDGSELKRLRRLLLQVEKRLTSEP